jgi:hypothetical protein
LSNDGHDLSSGDGIYGYDTNYAHYSESSKSGKSGDAKASKYDEALTLEDDDVYDLGDGSGNNEHGSSGDGESSEDGSGNIYDNLANDSLADDSTFNDVLTQTAFGIEGVTMSMSGSSSSKGADDSKEMVDETQSTEGDEMAED